MRITGLWWYPVKGCRGVAAPEVMLTTSGIARDRDFMIVDAKGVFVTQRDVPELARIDARYDGDTLVLGAADRAPLRISASGDGPDREVQVWSSRGTARDAGDEAAAWLAALLGAPYRLVRAAERWQREHKGPFAGPINFVDGFPLLVISEASLADLNTRLPSPVPMARFRPNIVVDGIPPYAEDALDAATCRGITLRGVKPCTRCAVTTTDQLTGERDRASEPLRTLARYRNDRELRGVKFGMNLAITSGAGEVLRVGDRLETVLR